MSPSKKNFFDREAVINAMDKATRRALSRIGAFVRTRVRSSMKRRKKVAVAGQAPSAHEGSLKNKLYFAYDQRTKSVVVGPVPYRKGNVPRLMEEGGTTTIVRRGKVETAHYAKHPYMGPGLAAERQAGTIPNAFKDSINR